MWFRMVCAALVLPGLSFGLGIDRTFYPGSVLQQGVSHPVGGVAEGGASVTLEFAGQSHTTTANASGRWTVALDALDARVDPGELTVRSGQDELTVSNLFVGDVWWVCGEPGGP